MKRIFIIFTLLFTTLALQARGNYLHSITLEKNNTGYNVILNSDSNIKVNKKSVSDNEIVLELSGIKSSDTVNALYKGTNEIDNLIIENTSPNKLKVYITAPNIKSSSIFVEPENEKGTLVGEDFPLNKTLWAIFTILLLGLIFKRSKKKSIEDSNVLIKKDIKNREIELYRRYRRKFEQDSLNSSKDARIQTMLKKIDRKIDERLMSSIK